MVDSIRPIDISNTSNIASDEANRTKTHNIKTTRLSGPEEVTQRTQAILSALEDRIKSIVNQLLGVIPARQREDQKKETTSLLNDLISTVKRMNSSEDITKILNDIPQLKKSVYNAIQNLNLDRGEAQFVGAKVVGLEQECFLITQDLINLRNRAPNFLKDGLEKANSALEQAYSIANKSPQFAQLRFELFFLFEIMSSIQGGEVFQGDSQKALKIVRKRCETLIDQLPPNTKVLSDKLKELKSALTDAIVVPIVQVGKTSSLKAGMRQLRQRI